MDTKEKCVLCGAETEYDTNTPVDNRNYYIEGIGQLCENCHNKDYCAKTDNSQIVENAATAKKHRLSVMQKIYRVIKAFMDFWIALISLILLSPLFLIVAIAIKVDSKGPVFFVQKRIGRKGKLFNCIKFRSMSTDARPDVAGYEYANVASYVTKVGNILRKLSIDELPQLINILTFKMSLIGYRPSQSCEEELNNAREMYGVHQLVPGISGWAQVNGRDILAANPTKKAEFDAYYLSHFSIWLDIKIFFKTIINVFRGDDIIDGIINKADDPMAECVADVATKSETSKDSTIVDNESLENKEDTSKSEIDEKEINDSLERAFQNSMTDDEPF